MSPFSAAWMTWWSSFTGVPLNESVVVTVQGRGWGKGPTPPRNGFSVRQKLTNSMLRHSMLYIHHRCMAGLALIEREFYPFSSKQSNTFYRCSSCSSSMLSNTMRSYKYTSTSNIFKHYWWLSPLFVGTLHMNLRCLGVSVKTNTTIPDRW